MTGGLSEPGVVVVMVAPKNVNILGVGMVMDVVTVVVLGDFMGVIC